MSREVIQIKGPDFNIGIPDVAAPVLEWESAGMRLEVEGISCDGFQERQALVGKNRRHRAEDGLSAGVEQERTIPFGCEFQVRRRMTVADGFVQVTVDVRAGNGGRLRQCVLDPVRLSGQWRRFGVSMDGRHFEWHEVGEEERTLTFPVPPLRCLAEDLSGARLEVGCGDDLWRHRIAESLPQCAASFSMTVTRREISLERRVLDFAADAEVPARAWRWEYCMAWVTSGATADSVGETDAVRSELTDWEGPVGGLRQGPAADGAFCMMAPSVRRRLRDLVRSAGASLVLEVPPPGVCAAASHLDRGGRVELLHWDFGERLALKLWGCRQLGRSGGALFLDTRHGGDGCVELVLARRLRPLKDTEDED